MANLTEDQVNALINKTFQKSQFSVPKVPYHTHNGIDSAPISSSGSSVSINGLATGSSVTSIPASTPTLLKPTQAFANGITFNATGSDYGFTIVTAGQYLVTSLVNYTSTQASYLYRNIIQLTPSGGSQAFLVEVDYAGAGGTQVGIPLTYVGNFGVGDLIQLYTEEQYSGGGTVANDATKTYLAIAKV